LSKVYYIIGVSGCGKSTIGSALSEKWDIPFYDGDDFHPKENIAKMKSGIPLNDDDRKPWLEAINKFARDQVANGALVIACSALKASYRQILIADLGDLFEIIHLAGSFELIEERMKARDHFMPSSLLQSQFDTLEAPTNALEVSINQSIEEMVNQINENMLSEVGLVGLGVMGTSLARNIANNGFRLSLYNRRVEGKEEKIALKAIAKFSELENARGFENLKDFVKSIERPRKIVLMITAGRAVDSFINDIRRWLDPGDILVDGGNTFYKDTDARVIDLAKEKIDWIGAGISGGEEGALRGPSIMPGGGEVQAVIL